MTRVASLYLPNWPIDRLLRAERRIAPPPADAGPAFDALGEAASAERAAQCSVPREGNWRPGARWARGDPGAGPGEGRDAVAALPAHRRPPQRELGRVSEAADNPFGPAGDIMARRPELAGHPFKPMPPDESTQAPMLRPAPPPLRPGESPHRPEHAPAASSEGTGRFFQTGQMLGSVVARVFRHEGDPRPTRAKASLVTVHKIGGRVEIAAVSPGARALGIAPGMALTQARAQVPGLDVHPADTDGDRADLLRLAERLARRWTPIVAVSDTDGLLLDLTGSAHLHGGEARMLARLVRVLARTGISARMAVADTAGAAWAAARFAGKSTVLIPPGGQVAALASFPVAALRLESPALDLLSRLGIDTIGQLLALPRAPLVRRFGAAITTRLDQATGRAPEPLVAVRPAEAIAVVERFAEPIATAEAIAHWLGMLFPALAGALAAAGRGARVVDLVADRVDGAAQRLRLGFARPTRDAAHMLRLTLRRIEEIEPGYGLDALRLHVRRSDPLGPETLGAHLAEQAPCDLAPLVDSLANRIGAHRLWRMAQVDSDVPERSTCGAGPLDDAAAGAVALPTDDVRRLDRRMPDHPWHPRWPRPVRLLHRPEPVDHVLAGLPDQPPRRFTWRGRTHRVVHADGPERIGGEWWRRPAERSAIRDYFHVEDETGERFWLYRRGDGVRPETGDLSWHMHGRLG